jgi:hypothetical protein
MIHSGTHALPTAPVDVSRAGAGYCQPWVVAPGGQVTLHASLPEDTTIDVVRMACINAEHAADGAPIGPPERIVSVPAAPTWQRASAIPALLPGGQVRVQAGPLPPAARTSLVLALHRQARGVGGTVLTLLDAQGRGLHLVIETGPDARSAHLGFRHWPETGAATACPISLPCGEWLLLVLDFEAPADAAPHLRVRSARCRSHVPGGTAPIWYEALAAWPTAWPSTWAQLTLGTQDTAHPSADVRMDLLSIVPSVATQTLQPSDLASAGHAAPTAWEASVIAQGQACLLRGRTGTDTALTDLCGAAVLTDVQRPYTAVRGLRWDGTAQGPAQAPAHYSAWHLNADTLLDARWPATLAWQVPADLASGGYAFRLRSAGDAPVVYAGFFVSAATRPRERLAVLLPTFSYLAYANATEEMRGPPISAAPHVAEAMLDARHPAYGRSIYERHADGQGVLYASSRRPLLSVGPGHRPWQWVADTWLLDWLEGSGQAFDVITDHDLHTLGTAALARYAVLLTGHHPEYWSTPMWDGLWQYLQGGGRLMYLGGNGLYWRTAYDPATETIEVRRAEDGTRPHIAPPGEYHCAFSGEFGGLWRRLGRPPQQIVGVGMAAQGFERATHYRWCADACAPEMAFVRQGLTAPTFGHAGALGGGASGWEIDRIDADLGTPDGTWWLARSEGHAPDMLRTKEELLSYVPPFADAKARSDMALAPVGQGDVFAVGSMTWVGALHGATAGEPTDVAKITAHVLHRLLDPTPIPRRGAPHRA